jgi:hypothetical protein
LNPHERECPDDRDYRDKEAVAREHISPDVDYVGSVEEEDAAQHEAHARA